jgi:hypothetical protein
MGIAMKEYNRLFIGGDSAIDEIIVDNIKLNDVHVFKEEVNVYKIDASAKLLHEIIKNYINNQTDILTGFTSDSESKYLTLSRWVEKTIDNKTGLFLDQYIGVKSPQGPDYDNKSENIQDKQIAVICDVYNSKYGYYNDLADKFTGWIVVRTLPEKDRKMSYLMQKLYRKGNKEKIIILLNSKDLRNAGYDISAGISWEQLITETYRALSGSGWSKFAYLIICFEHEGIMLFDNTHRKHTVIFYPNEIEGDYLRNHSKVFGHLITFQAALAICLCKRYNELEDINAVMSVLTDASKAGIGAMRELLGNGFSISNANELYPYKIICAYFKDVLEAKKDIPVTILDLTPERIVSNMTILEEICRDRIYKERAEEITDAEITDAEVANKIINLYKMIITHGIESDKSLKNIPVLQYEHLITADRYEMEGYRKIHNLFERYLSDQKADTPLSICVFGSPGSGKSFGIKQMTRHFEKKTITQIITFNLSQFNLDDLASAFDQVRDISLEGKLPIVFWDEFDCEVNGQPLGWLKRFLAPMQDGEYYENANRHLIGRSIFVFAGGVYKTSGEMENEKEKYKDRKLPDFISRIAGSLDVPGLNKKKCGDSLYMVRRAVIIRKLLESHLGISENREINDNISKIVIEKLLNRSEDYEHGTRTLETEIKKLFITNS